jgi:hypothetical protein
MIRSPGSCSKIQEARERGNDRFGHPSGALTEDLVCASGHLICAGGTLVCAGGHLLCAKRIWFARLAAWFAQLSTCFAQLAIWSARREVNP